MNRPSRTTSLEDIYRHVTGHTILPTSPTTSRPHERPKGFEPRKDFSSFINYEDDYDEGEVTGFAVSCHKSPPTTNMNLSKPISSTLNRLTKVV